MGMAISRKEFGSMIFAGVMVATMGGAAEAEEVAGEEPDVALLKKIETNIKEVIEQDLGDDKLSLKDVKSKFRKALSVTELRKATDAAVDSGKYDEFGLIEIRTVSDKALRYALRDLNACEERLQAYGEKYPNGDGKLRVKKLSKAFTKVEDDVKALSAIFVADEGAKKAVATLKPRARLCPNGYLICS